MIQVSLDSKIIKCFTRMRSVGCSLRDGQITTKIDDLDKSINQKFLTLNTFLESEFDNVKFRIKNALYLVLKKLEKVPGLTVTELQKGLNISRKTLYSYLKKLQDKNILLSQVKKSRGKGRPPKAFTLNIKKLLQKQQKKGSD